ncbi:MAG: SCO family protein [Acidobacteriota bacterium]|nr:MAG: SCO family protein [Acidobacteriota bacterium]
MHGESADKYPATSRRRRCGERAVQALIGVTTGFSLLLVVGCGSGPRGDAAPPVIKQLPEFSLTNQLGESFGSTELEGRPYVANFFFTSCVTVCPRLMHQTATLRRRFREAGFDGICFVSISVDPEVDRPEKLRRYGELRNIDSADWVLLTGEKQSIRTLLTEGFMVAVGQREPLEEDLYEIAHSAKLVLVDRQGAVRGYYSTDEQGLAEIFRDASVLR